MFVLDTDHISILQKKAGDDWRRLRHRLDQYPRTDFFVTIVSFHEQVAGWQSLLGRANSAAGILHAYSMMERLLATFAGSQVLPFDAAAIQLFADFRRHRVRIDTMDLRIACTAITRGMTLLTRITVDFARVPGLKFEDWTVEDAASDSP
uniref:Type II toxin-antitoxin system VapC family toxin n=1 Tax=Schlesneria paludicola TaxID=360056 RepID=A0A7C2JZ30_9PLAN